MSSFTSCPTAEHCIAVSLVLQTGSNPSTLRTGELVRDSCMDHAQQHSYLICLWHSCTECVSDDSNSQLLPHVLHFREMPHPQGKQGDAQLPRRPRWRPCKQQQWLQLLVRGSSWIRQVHIA